MKVGSLFGAQNLAHGVFSSGKDTQSSLVIPAQRQDLCNYYEQRIKTDTIQSVDYITNTWQISHSVLNFDMKLDSNVCRSNEIFCQPTPR